jgi:hypothetical protein
MYNFEEIQVFSRKRFEIWASGIVTFARGIKQTIGMYFILALFTVRLAVYCTGGHEEPH